MIIMIMGASHTGKTALAQKLLEKYKYPYLSIDHLKMGLIRSGNAHLTPLSDGRELTAYLWGIVREMIKTAIENGQNLTVEGCYIPFDWRRGFSEEYLSEIRCCCLAMSDGYIRSHFSDIMQRADIIEQRLADDFTMESALQDNALVLEAAERHGVDCILIDKEYAVDIDL